MSQGQRVLRSGALCEVILACAGNFVKQVHNGIEYGDMQLISEVLFLSAQSSKTLSNPESHPLLYCLSRLSYCDP